MKYTGYLGFLFDILTAKIFFKTKEKKANDKNQWQILALYITHLNKELTNQYTIDMYFFSMPKTA